LQPLFLESPPLIAQLLATFLADAWNILVFHVF
jgi:hypothetical protein